MPVTTNNKKIIKTGTLNTPLHYVEQIAGRGPGEKRELEIEKINRKRKINHEKHKEKKKSGGTNKIIVHNKTISAQT